MKIHYVGRLLLFFVLVVTTSIPHAMNMEQEVVTHHENQIAAIYNIKDTYQCMSDNYK